MTLRNCFGGRPDAEWTYAYDPFGRRVAKQGRERDHRVPSGPGWDAWRGTTYAWDGDVIAREVEERATQASGTPSQFGAVVLRALDPPAALRVTDWHHEPGTFRPLARLDHSSCDAPERVLFVVTDHLGTPRELLTTSGEAVWCAQLTTWGTVRRLAVAANDNHAQRDGHRFASGAMGGGALRLAEIDPYAVRPGGHRPSSVSRSCGDLGV